MAKDKRDMWALRLTTEEKAMLKHLADLEGVSMSGMFRMLVRRSYDRRKISK